MQERGITAIDGPNGLAERATVARNTIYAWESGSYPSVGELERVAGVLQLSTWELLRAWEGTDAAPSAAPPWADALERKLDVLLARSGVDPVDAQDEAEARRLVAEALAIVQHEQEADEA